MSTLVKIVVGAGLAGIILLGLWFGLRDATSRDVFPGLPKQASATAVRVDGKQYVDISVHRGYAPETTYAKAGIETVLRFTTQNTFDCSAALVLPALDVQRILKSSEVVEIVVPVHKATGTLEGMCSMGMYHFEVVFE